VGMPQLAREERAVRGVHAMLPLRQWQAPALCAGLRAHDVAGARHQRRRTDSWYPTGQKILLGVNAVWRDDEQIPNYEGDGGR
jgi:hypothetical protein